MDMTRRQFALSVGAAASLHSSLFDDQLSPIGVPRGVVPGRVSWAHDPAAVTWDGAGSWWTDANNNQAVIDRMVSHSIRGLTNQKSDAQAWNAMFTTSTAPMAAATLDTRPARRSPSRRT